MFVDPLLYFLIFKPELTLFTSYNCLSIKVCGIIQQLRRPTFETWKH